ncbi:hypothetical protein [Streptomyces sp. ZL-24]|uniref:hypothetical protein n=1 Tax=Streptomyces sp. ZL-24 TaxID=1933029 RepID=UPI0011AFFD8D|nr:hypothetical protein [Streptomyces sp. ZL-24]
MRIRMRIAMSGLRNGKPWPPVGQVTDLPTGEAQHLCASGIAEEVTDTPPAEETATPPEAETAKAPAAETSSPPAETKRGRGRPRKTPASEE